ncbi:MAG: glycosyl hydrolase family 65 protein [Roseicyclus sp.]
MQRCYTGIELRAGTLMFNPRLPEEVTRLRSTVRFRRQVLDFEITQDELTGDQPPDDRASGHDLLSRSGPRNEPGAVLHLPPDPRDQAGELGAGARTGADPGETGDPVRGRGRLSRERLGGFPVALPPGRSRRTTRGLAAWPGVSGTRSPRSEGRRKRPT